MRIVHKRHRLTWATQERAEDASTAFWADGTQADDYETREIVPVRISPTVRQWAVRFEDWNGDLVGWLGQ